MTEIEKKLQDIEAKAKKKGISIAALCRKAKVSNQSWQNWKNGIHEPRFRNLEAMQAALGN